MSDFTIALLQRDGQMLYGDKSKLQGSPPKHAAAVMQREPYHLENMFKNVSKQRRHILKVAPKMPWQELN